MISTTITTDMEDAKRALDELSMARVSVMAAQSWMEAEVIRKETIL